MSFYRGDCPKESLRFPYPHPHVGPQVGPTIHLSFGELPIYIYMGSPFLSLSWRWNQSAQACGAHMGDHMRMGLGDLKIYVCPSYVQKIILIKSSRAHKSSSFEWVCSRSNGSVHSNISKPEAHVKFRGGGYVCASQLDDPPMGPTCVGGRDSSVNSSRGEDFRIYICMFIS